MARGVRRVVGALTCSALVMVALVTEPASAAPGVARARPGTVIASGPLPHRLWYPGATEKAFLLKYVTASPFKGNALSTGTLFLPKGRAPRGGWPVISWAHGTSGIGNSCAPSRIGPALPARDRPYLAKWLRAGYAIVASDYVGLGTPGLMPFVNGEPTAHSVVDMVKAGREFAGAKLGNAGQLSRRWVVVGQSQGGGAAIYTARYASELGGRGLSYQGGVATGGFAYIERFMPLLGPGVAPIAVGHLTAYMAYILAGFRYVHPEVGINDALTPVGLEAVKHAETECTTTLQKELEDVPIGNLFTRSLGSLPGFSEAIADYMAMPEGGFDRPLFMGNGLLDTDVPYAFPAPYAESLTLRGEPITFRTYPGDHNQTLIDSQRDTIPFVRKLFAGPAN